MRWYRQIKRFLGRDRGKSAAPPHWVGPPAFADAHAQPALSSGTLDRRAIRLRRD